MHYHQYGTNVIPFQDSHAHKIHRFSISIKRVKKHTKNLKKETITKHVVSIDIVMMHLSWIYNVKWNKVMKKWASHTGDYGICPQFLVYQTCLFWQFVQVFEFHSIFEFYK